MKIILAIDALEIKLVEKFGCENLKQRFYGKTDISEFSQPRTMVLWSSFITGKNKEKDVLSNGNKEMWNKRWDIDDTFFSGFKNSVVIDLPGYSYHLDAHKKSRDLLKAFFETENVGKKENIRKMYNKDAFNHHKKIKKGFFEAIQGNHDLVLGYFSIADVIGHLNFGNNLMMKMIYRDLDDIAAKINEKTEDVLILSDHGMEGIGMFGNHSEYGFWSLNSSNIHNPKITEIFKLFLEVKNENRDQK